MSVLILGLVIFFVPHSISIVAAGWRDRTQARIGKGAWRGIYSILSLVALVLIVYGFGLARQDPIQLYTPPLWLHYLADVLMLPVFPLLLAAYLPGRLQTAAKHPFLAAIKFWATAHLLANGTLADVLLFGAFLAWAVVDRISLKRRPARPVPGLPRSALNDTIAIVGGLALYVVFVLWAHARLFGVQPFPVN